MDMHRIIHLILIGHMLSPQPYSPEIRIWSVRCVTFCRNVLNSWKHVLRAMNLIRIGGGNFMLNIIAATSDDGLRCCYWGEIEMISIFPMRRVRKCKMRWGPKPPWLNLSDRR